MFRLAFLGSHARIVALPLLALSLGAYLHAQSIVPLTDAEPISPVDNPATMSGDGSTFFYFRHAVSDPYRHESVAGTLYMRRAQSAVPIILADNVYVDWMLSDRTGSRLVFGVFAVQRHPDPLLGWSQIYSVDVERKELLPITTVPFALTGAAMPSPVLIPPVAMAEDAGKIVFSSSSGLIGIYTVSWNGGMPVRVGAHPAAALATDSRGQAIYYSKQTPDSERRLDLYRVDVSSGNQEQALALESSTSNRVNRIFTAADESVVFLSTFFRIFRFRPKTRKADVLFSDFRSEDLAALSRDGRWLIVESRENLTGENSDESYELFLLSVDGSVTRQLTRSDGSLVLASFFDTAASLSDDGKAAMLLTRHRLPGPGSATGSREQWLYRADLTQQQPTFELLDFVTSQHHSAPVPLSDGRHFVFYSKVAATDGGQFFIGSSNGHAIRQLSQLNLSDVTTYAVSGDGQVLAYVQIDSQRSKQRIFLYRSRDRKLILVGEIGYTCCPLADGSVALIPRVSGMSLDESGENFVFATNVRLGSDEYRTTGQHLYVARLGEESTPTRLSAAGHSVEISKNGQVIAFESGGGITGFTEPRTVFTARPDGSNVVSLGVGNSLNIDARGEWAVFLRNAQIVLARTDGTFEKSLTTEASGISFSSARISADGQTIVGMEGKPSDYQTRFFLFLDRTGKETGRILLPQQTFIYGWSVNPDGKQIYFRKGTSAGSNSFTVRMVPFVNYTAQVVSPEDTFAGVALVNSSSEPALVNLSLRDSSGGLATAPVSVSLDPGHHSARLLSEFFGATLFGQRLDLEVESRQKVDSYALTGSADLDRMEGGAATSTALSRWLLPVDASGPAGPRQTRVTLLLTNPQPTSALVTIHIPAPGFGRIRHATVPAFGNAGLDMTEDLPASSALSPASLIEVVSSAPVAARLQIRDSSQRSMTALTPADELLASELLILPHVIEGAGFSTRVWVANPTVRPTEVEVAFLDASGNLHPSPSNPMRVHLDNRQVAALSLADLTGADQIKIGYLRIRALAPAGRVSALALVFGQDSLYSVEAIRSMRRRVVFPHAVQDGDFYTAYAVVNPHEFPVRFSVDVFDDRGTRQSQQIRIVGAGQMLSGLLSDFTATKLSTGYFTIEGEWPLSVLALIGASRGSALANLPQQ